MKHKYRKSKPRKRKPSKNKPRARIKRPLVPDVVDDIKELHRDPLSSEMFKGWEEIESPDAPAKKRIAKIQDGVLEATAIIAHSAEQSTLTIINEATQDGTKRDLMLSASKRHEAMIIQEEESFPDIPDLNHGCKVYYTKIGNMYVWCPYTSYTDGNSFASTEDQHAESATPFLNAPKDQLFSAHAVFHADEGPLIHTFDVVAAMAPAYITNGQQEVVVDIAINPKHSSPINPLSWLGKRKKRSILFGPFPLRLSHKNITALLRKKMKGILS